MGRIGKYLLVISFLIVAVAMAQVSQKPLPGQDLNNTWTGTNAFNQLNGCQYVNATQTFAQALAAASNPGCIQIAPGTYTVAVNASVPAGVTLGFSQGGILSIATGVTLTVNGPISAQPAQIFAYVGTGTTNISTLNPVQAAWFPGADLGVQTNNAFASCKNTAGQPSTYCEVILPGGLYTYGTTIALPNSQSDMKYRLTFAPGAYIQYTGSGDAISAIATVSTSDSGVQIQMGGGALYCTGNLGNGIHLLGSTMATLDRPKIQSCYSGILSEMSTTTTVIAPDIRFNRIGMRHLAGLFLSNPSSSNNNTVLGGEILGNTIWGVMDDATNQANSANFHNTHFGTTIEGNGGPTSSVSITSCSRASNVVTLTTATSMAGIVNEVVKIAGSTGGATSFNGWFKILTSNGTTQVTYAQTGPNESCTASTGTAQRQNGNAFIEGGDSYLFDGIWWEYPASGELSHVVVGTSNISAAHNDFVNSTLGDGNATSFIDVVNGSGTRLDGMRVPIAMTNLVNMGTLPTQTVIWEPKGLYTNICAPSANCNSTTLSMSKEASRGLAIGGYFPSGSIGGDIAAIRSATSGCLYHGGDANVYLCRLSGTNLSFNGSSFIPAGVGSTDIGGTANPWTNLWLGTALTNNFQLNALATAGARKLVWWDWGASGLSTQQQPATVVLHTAYTNATTTFSTLGDGTRTASFPVVANVDYTVSCKILFQGSVTTAGPKVQITGPASPTAVMLAVDGSTGAAAFADAGATAFSTPVTAFGTLGAGTTNFTLHIDVGVSNGANAGTVAVQLAANGAGTLTVQPGSYCRIQ